MTLPIAVNTISDTWTVPMEESLQRRAGHGYRHFDVMVSPAHLDTENLTPVDFRRLRKLLKDEGQQIISLTTQSLDHNFASPRPEIRAMTTGFTKSMLNTASELEVPGIVVVSGRYNPLNAPPRAQLEGWLRESLEAIVPYAEKVGVKLFLENVPMGVLPTADLLMQWVKEINSPALTICYDVSNGHFIKEDVAQAVRLVAPKLDLLHLSDTTQEAWRHDPIGTGTIDHAAVAKVLLEIGYDRFSVIEILAANPIPVILSNHDILTGMGWEKRRGAAA